MTAFITAELGLGTIVNGAFTEPTAAEYARQTVTFTNFPSASGTLDAAAQFGTVVTSWGTLTSFCLFDEAGNQVIVDSLSSPINADVGQNVTVFAGAITLTFSA
jgi:hypothetical protein